MTLNGKKRIVLLGNVGKYINIPLEGEEWFPSFFFYDYGRGGYGLTQLTDQISDRFANLAKAVAS
jgi:hypothetical protein